MHTPTDNSLQAQFNQEWISAGEIRTILGISTATLSLAITRGSFPRPDVLIGNFQMGLWKRERVRGEVGEWMGRLRERRGRTRDPLVPSNNPPWDKKYT